MISLIKRNMKLFFYDRTAVFFSFMAVFVVLGLYVCFLGEMMIRPLMLNFPQTAREISDTWIMAGTMGIVSLTTSLSVLGIIIDDKSKGIRNDFEVSPLSRTSIHIAYILSTILITCFVSIITLCIGQLYIVIYGGEWMSVYTCMKLLGVMMISVLSSTCMLYYMMSFFKSATSFSNVTTIIGTLSGFLMGIYVPVGALPKLLQTIISYFPPSHSAALYRNIMMQDVLQRSYQGTIDITFKKQFGLVFQYGEHVSTLLDSLCILAMVGGIFWILLQVRKRKVKIR